MSARMLRAGWVALSIGLLLPLILSAQVQERFPKPDFQSGYTRPELQIPVPRSHLMEYLDILFLVAALALAAYFAHKLRSRRWLFTLMVVCLAYFGFVRKGCVCSVGAVQNVTLALFDSGYAVPLTVIAFFLLPLVFTLFFGRTFCAAVCPLGAVQDVVILKPVRVPAWLAEVLGVLPYLYLGLAVLFAATGAGFIICRFDPFVGFFRFGGGFNMVLVGAFLLILGTVVARPYCRFLCPYGAILNWLSRLSRRHVRITPTECSNCRLCEESCPFGAIRLPDEAAVRESRPAQVRRLAGLLLLLPVIVFGAGLAGSRFHVPLARAHPTVSLAEEIQAEDAGRRTEMSDAAKAFRSSGKTTEDLMAEVAVIRARFRRGGWLLGGFIGLILGSKLIAVTIRRRRPEYDLDTGNCLSCGRCFPYCPYEHVRRGLIGPDEIEDFVARRGKNPQEN